MSERDADMGVGSVAHGRTYTAEEVTRLASNGADLLIVDGLVVDFSAFTHPGGRAVLTRHAGEDVSDMFRGIAGTRPRSSSHKPMAHMRSDAHAHSAAAFSMLTRLAVGTIDATAASETGAEEDGPFARVRARRAQLAMHTGAEGADTAVDDEKGEGGIRSSLGSTVGSDASSMDGEDPSGSEDDDEREPGDTSGVDLPGKHHPATSDKTDFGIDRTRALVHQVGSLGARYHEWVHTPEVSDAPLRFFENDWAEAATRTPWWLVPCVWLPLAAYTLCLGVHTGIHSGFTSSLALTFGYDDEGAFGYWFGNSIWLLSAMGTWCAGYWFWGVLEYTFHRFAFHVAPSSYWGITAHFLMHGCHHKAPLDGLRLVFPPTASAPIIFGFWKVFRAVVGGWLGCGDAAATLFWSGCLAGYVAYDCTHYFLHHWEFEPRKEGRRGGGLSSIVGAVSRWYTGTLRKARSTHMAHHYDDSDTSFGITSGVFDRAFGTAPKKPKAKTT